MLNQLLTDFNLSEKLFTLLSGNVNDAVLFILDNKVVYTNEAGNKIFGFPTEEIVTLTFEELARKLIFKSPGESAAPWEPEPFYRDESVYTVQFTSKYGRKGTLEMRITPCLREHEIDAKLLIFRDVTHKLALRAEANHLHRIANLGKISAGIAHDLNHFLTLIFSENTRLLLQVKKGEQKESLEKIEDAINQAISIVARIKEFGRVENINISPVNINEIIDRTLNLLRKNWEIENCIKGKKINVVFEPGEQCQVLGHMASLSSVFINLINNAMDAIAKSGEIKICISKQNSKVYVSISDNGIGMVPEVQQKIFTPFYSTKQESGSGLGLFISREIIREHKGTIRVISCPEKGSTFIVTLPSIAENTRKKTRLSRSKYLVYVIDDEKPICDLLSGMLSGAGYRVHAVQSRAEAVRHIAKHRPDLIISDLCCPDLSLHELIKENKSTGLNIPIILLTGFGSYVDEGTMSSLGIKAVISKPFSERTLLKTVERLLVR